MKIKIDVDSVEVAFMRDGEMHREADGTCPRQIWRTVHGGSFRSERD